MSIEYVTVTIPVPTVRDDVAFLLIAALFGLLVMANRIWWRE